jgi:hypothetical protein
MAGVGDSLSSERLDETGGIADEEEIPARNDRLRSQRRQLMTCRVHTIQVEIAEQSVIFQEMVKVLA